MYASISPSETNASTMEAHSHQRVMASAAASFKQVGSVTRLERLYQQGSAKIRFPKVHSPALEAVLINTAGGLTGGDRLDWNLHLSEGTNVVATTQACEKSYKANEGTAQLATTIKLESNSRLDWLPQETILYDGSSLSRTLDVEMAEDTEFLGIESLVLGRAAMGETVSELFMKDRWRIRKNNKLIYGDDIRLEGAGISIAQLAHNQTVLSLVYVSKHEDEFLRAIVSKLRQACPAPLSGFSAFEGKITGRILTKDSYLLRQALMPVLKILRGAELPRVWRI